MTIINLLQAYELDKLSKFGLTDEEIVQTLENEDVSTWQDKEPNFDFSEIMALYKEGEQLFLNALHGDYQIKYVTLPGIQRLLQLRFQLEEGRDYQLLEMGINQLSCEKEVITQLKNILSANWQISKQSNDTYAISVANINKTK